jgi:hypothetical protein
MEEERMATKSKPNKPEAAQEAQTPAQTPEPEPTQEAVPATDPHHGQGGLYEIRNGNRVLIERTKHND